MGSSWLAPLFVSLYRSWLETRIDVLHDWLIFWTAVLVCGLTFEVWAEVLDPFIHGPFVKRGRSVKAVIHLYSTIGLMLVIAGVVGELRVESSGPVVEGKLRELNNSIVAGVQNETGKANERASANEKGSG